jgi:hypothetical protein
MKKIQLTILLLFFTFSANIIFGNEVNKIDDSKNIKLFGNHFYLGKKKLVTIKDFRDILSFDPMSLKLYNKSLKLLITGYIFMGHFMLSNSLTTHILIAGIIWGFIGWIPLIPLIPMICDGIASLILMIFFYSKSRKIENESIKLYNENIILNKSSENKLTVDLFRICLN